MKLSSIVHKENGEPLSRKQSTFRPVNPSCLLIGVLLVCWSLYHLLSSLFGPSLLALSSSSGFTRAVIFYPKPHFPSQSGPRETLMVGIDLCPSEPEDSRSAMSKTEAHFASQKEDFSCSFKLAAESPSQTPDILAPSWETEKGIASFQGSQVDRWWEASVLEMHFSQQITFA